MRHVPCEQLKTPSIWLELLILEKFADRLVRLFVGAEIIVVVSHQREPNDNKLAEKLKPGTVDIVLGGHDHYYAHSIINGTHVLRSGSDFKQLSYIEARRKPDGSKGKQVDGPVDSNYKIARNISQKRTLAPVIYWNSLVKS